MPRLGWIIGFGFLSSWEGRSFPCAISWLDDWYQYRVSFGIKKSFLVLGWDGESFPCGRIRLDNGYRLLVGKGRAVPGAGLRG